MNHARIENTNTIKKLIQTLHNFTKIFMKFNTMFAYYIQNYSSTVHYAFINLLEQTQNMNYSDNSREINSELSSV